LVYPFLFLLQSEASQKFKTCVMAPVTRSMPPRLPSDGTRGRHDLCQKPSTKGGQRGNLSQKPSTKGGQRGNLFRKPSTRRGHRRNLPRKPSTRKGQRVDRRTRRCDNEQGGNTIANDGIEDLQVEFAIRGKDIHNFSTIVWHNSDRVDNHWKWKIAYHVLSGDYAKGLDDDSHQFKFDALRVLVAANPADLAWMNRIYYNNMNMFLVAAPNANTKIIEFLISHGVDSRQTSPNGHTALTLAMELSTNARAVRWMLDNHQLFPSLECIDACIAVADGNLERVVSLVKDGTITKKGINLMFDLCVTFSMDKVFVLLLDLGLQPLSMALLVLKAARRAGDAEMKQTLQDNKHRCRPENHNVHPEWIEEQRRKQNACRHCRCCSSQPAQV
jgi:hypothetical protein